jgi:hypothetical protein
VVFKLEKIVKERPGYECFEYSNDAQMHEKNSYNGVYFVMKFDVQKGRKQLIITFTPSLQVY